MKQILYNYYVHPIIEKGKVEGYMAVIPAFNNSVAFGDTLEELQSGIAFGIKTSIENLKKRKMPIPKPEYQSKTKQSGKFVLRTSPELHFHLILAAKANKKSLNKFIEETLEASLKK